MADTPFLADIKRRDPRGVALRRAARVAVTVPAAVLILNNIPMFSATALFGVFATISLLIFADFGGPLPERAIAYLATVAAAIPILILGVTFSESVVGAVAVMGGVALVVGLLAVLRGVIASAQTVLLLSCVLAVTSAPPNSQAAVCGAWVVGGLIATCAALLLWPARRSYALRHDLGRIYQKAGAAVRNRWGLQPGVLERDFAGDLEDSVNHLHGTYDGNLMRPSGLTSSDRELAELVDITSRLSSYQRWIDITPKSAGHDAELAKINGEFATVIADQLDATGARLLGEKAGGSAQQVLAAREHHLDQASEWAHRNRGSLPTETLRQRLDDMFPLRLTSASSELAAANSLHERDYVDPTLGDQLEHPRRGIITRLTSHLSWSSPWLRNALRSAVALAGSVLIAKTLAFGHEFWIVLGTLTALRFDALGTGRTAMQALIGTTAGVAVASVFIVMFSGNTAAWWVLLPISLFLCAFTPGTFSLAIGQASFSLAVLVLFSLLYPASLLTAELRLVDVAIGLVVSLLISLVMWPRGVASTLYARMSEAMSAATDFLTASIDHIAGGAVDDQALREYARRSASTLDRAQEAYDLSVAQRPPKSVPVQRWSRVANATRHVDATAHLIPGAQKLVTQRGDDRAIPPSVVGPLLDASNDLRDRLRSALATWQEMGAHPAPPESPEVVAPPSDALLPNADSVATLRAAIAEWLEQPDHWTGTNSDPRPAVLAWMADWMAFIGWNAERLRRDLQTAVTANP